MVIRPAGPTDFAAIYEIINEAAEAYRGVIAPDCWHEPYMSQAALRQEIDDGVTFWGVADGRSLVSVMGLQHVREVALIRHAYTRPTHQRRGCGSALLAHFCGEVDRPILVGTWRAAGWAISFYERHGFALVTEDEKNRLLRSYWSVSARQIEESVVLADHRWFATH